MADRHLADSHSIDSQSVVFVDQMSVGQKVFGQSTHNRLFSTNCVIDLLTDQLRLFLFDFFCPKCRIGGRHNNSFYSANIPCSKLARLSLTATLTQANRFLLQQLSPKPNICYHCFLTYLSGVPRVVHKCKIKAGVAGNRKHASLLHCCTKIVKKFYDKDL
jgi:hypothetical protein